MSEVEVIRLSRKAQEQFVKLSTEPPAPAPALKRAFARRRTLIRK